MAYIEFLGTVAILQHLYMTVAYIRCELDISASVSTVGIWTWVAIHLVGVLDEQNFADLSEHFFQNRNFLSFPFFLVIYMFVSLRVCQHKVGQKSVRAHSTQHASADPCALHLHTVQLRYWMRISHHCDHTCYW
jgi:hypothetical protein